MTQKKILKKQKHTNKKHTNKKYKKTKRSTKRNFKMLGGTCNCGLKYNGGTCGCTPSSYRGGSAFLDQLDNQHYYKFSNHNGDPTNPTNMIDERLSGDFSRTSGGKRKNKNMRKIKGGDFFSRAYNTISDYGSNMNYITSFGIPNGVGSQMNLINAYSGSNNNPTLHPVLTNPYGFQNPPLV